MKAERFIFALLLVVIAACRKFKHKTTFPITCEMCAYADELEGVYEGVATGLSVYTTTGGNYGDSMRISVEHVFQNHGAYIDSTVMYLKLTTKYHSLSWSTTRIIEMHAKGSFTYFAEGDHYSQFSMTPDSIRISKVTPPTAPQGGLELMDYVGIKQ